MEPSTKPANAALDVRPDAVDDRAPHLHELVDRDPRRSRTAPGLALGARRVLGTPLDVVRLAHAVGTRRSGILGLHAWRSSTWRATPRRFANARGRAAAPQCALARTPAPLGAAGVSRRAPPSGS